MYMFCQSKNATCTRYSPDINLDFRYIEAEQGALFIVEDKSDKHLIFFLEGSMKVWCNEFAGRVFSAGEMIFLPNSAYSRGEALTKCSFIVHTYDVPVKLCDRSALDSIVEYAKRANYEFASLPINDLLRNYLLLLKTYLAEGVNCRHMHELKQKELFLLLRALYTSLELARFFCPILGKSLSFRNIVMSYYPKARTARELASFCHYSEGHFNELFVAEFGETPYQWMRKQKAKHIMGYLAQSDASLEEISDEFNFTSRSHFNKYCKVQFGQSAIQIRQNITARGSINE